MGWLNQLDMALQQQLTRMTHHDGPLLRTVGPLRATGRSPVPDPMLAAAAPAFFYSIRHLSEPGDGVLAQVQALLIVQALTGHDSPWRGDTNTIGAYALADDIAHALARFSLPGIAGVWLRHQHLAYADGRAVAFTQDYDVMQAGEHLMLDDATLIASPAIVQIVQTKEASLWQSETPTGSETHWVDWRGRSPSSVTVAGTLWADGHVQLQQIEARLQELLADRSTHDLATASGLLWPDVALLRWQRTGSRRVQPMLALTGQDIRIEFEQYLL